MIVHVEIKFQIGIQKVPGFNLASECIYERQFI